MPERSDSDRWPALGTVTNDPPPAPFAVRIMLCAVNSRSASRIVARLTPNSSASTVSFGRREPSSSTPSRICSRSRIAISS
jgi:hypothetical protein